MYLFLADCYLRLLRNFDAIRAIQNSFKTAGYLKFTLYDIFNALQTKAKSIIVSMVSNGLPSEELKFAKEIALENGFGEKLIEFIDNKLKEVK